MPNHTEDAAQEAIDRASAAGKQVGGMAKQGAKKLATKVGKQAMKAVGRAVAQGVGSILVSIAPFVVPILVGALVIGGLFSTFYLIEQDSRPAVQNQQNTPQEIIFLKRTSYLQLAFVFNKRGPNPFQ